jgi:nucleoid DNA-binding protein
MKKAITVGRSDFVKQLMRRSGFKYVEACQAYETMISTLSDAITRGDYVCLGEIGALVPSIVPPKQVRMGFVMKKGGKTEKLTREFFLDSRLKYKFRLFKGFVKNHQLHWPVQ